ncbi:RnfABCDGE type electron transport complex subunit G [Caldithrix abyssi]|uniref:Ion-translocating oxidoreductase complex subunit G n=1 Tax=Caldithrix abyssi DSM 13497 TaxID=880073 RepID=H1XPQ6_CALAY|nr:RnfABCDGE type electron transport complex subunit G [Caldithrix abyssi]APF19880.1 electron transport complex protein RnfG [Caldithrix abyssi DSM 13497]EHO39977.1 electron transport complex, RnfABCDGE type, G subunit [Caldithrix abyssi DSM 13497]
MDKQESGFKIISVLVLIAFFAAALLAYVNKITREPIARNMKEETRHAVRIVLNSLGHIEYPDDPLAKNLSSFQAKYFPARDSTGKVIGYAVIVNAPNGFSGDFEMMIGIDSTGKVLDTYVLNHKETPGLGDNMKKEDFRKQFRGRTLDNTKWAVKKDGGDIDALTAATITSRAFTSGVKRALMVFQALKEEKEK